MMQDYQSERVGDRHYVFSCHIKPRHQRNHTQVTVAAAAGARV
jgi:hypothetical protein